MSSTLQKRPKFVQQSILLEELLHMKENLSIKQRFDVLRNLRNCFEVWYDRESFEMISCHELKQKMAKANKLVIIDCRPSKDYN